MIAVGSAVCAGLAVVLALRPRGGELRWRVPVGLAVPVLGAAVLLDGRFPPVLVLLGVGLAAAAVREVRRRRAAAVRRHRNDAVLAVCEALCSDLHAGVPPVAALAAAAEAWPEFAVVADAAHLGADVPTALRVLGGRPGAEQLRVVAAAWVVAHRSGAGLAPALDLAARTIRDERATARVVATELAAAYATARLLAVLPFGVLLIGRGAGGDPIGFLLGTTPGLLCLASGIALAWVGLAWMQRIADGTGRT